MTQLVHDREVSPSSLLYAFPQVAFYQNSLSIEEVNFPAIITARQLKPNPFKGSQPKDRAINGKVLIVYFQTQQFLGKYFGVYPINRTICYLRQFHVRSDNPICNSFKVISG